MNNLEVLSDLLTEVARGIKERKKDRLNTKEISNLCKVATAAVTVEEAEYKKMTVGDPTKRGRKS